MNKVVVLLILYNIVINGKSFLEIIDNSIEKMAKILSGDANDDLKKAKLASIIKVKLVKEKAEEAILNLEKTENARIKLEEEVKIANDKVKEAEEAMIKAKKNMLRVKAVKKTRIKAKKARAKAKKARIQAAMIKAKKEARLKEAKARLKEAETRLNQKRVKLRAAMIEAKKRTRLRIKREAEKARLEEEKAEKVRVEAIKKNKAAIIKKHRKKAKLEQEAMLKAKKEAESVIVEETKEKANEAIIKTKAEKLQLEARKNKDISIKIVNGMELGIIGIIVGGLINSIVKIIEDKNKTNQNTLQNIRSLLTSGDAESTILSNVQYTSNTTTHTTTSNTTVTGYRC